MRDPHTSDDPLTWIAIIFLVWFFFLSSCKAPTDVPDPCEGAHKNVEAWAKLWAANFEYTIDCSECMNGWTQHWLQCTIFVPRPDDVSETRVLECTHLMCEDKTPNYIQ